MTRDRRHVTRDRWHVTRDMWHVTRLGGGVNILPSSYRLWFMILWRSGQKGWLAEWINEWMNDEAVYRTAPATPGLLKNSTYIFFFQYKKEHKPTGQAVLTDPSWCNSTNKKNPPMQQNCHNSWTNPIKI